VEEPDLLPLAYGIEIGATMAPLALHIEEGVRGDELGEEVVLDIVGHPRFGAPIRLGQEDLPVLAQRPLVGDPAPIGRDGGGRDRVGGTHRGEGRGAVAQRYHEDHPLSPLAGEEGDRRAVVGDGRG
jgi:hypothetical protein